MYLAAVEVAAKSAPLAAIITLPVPFADSSKSAFVEEVVISFPSIVIWSFAILVVAVIFPVIASVEPSNVALASP